MPARFIVFMKTSAYGDGFHEEGTFNTACFCASALSGRKQATRYAAGC
jgi:hypothetical protein